MPPASSATATALPTRTSTSDDHTYDADKHVTDDDATTADDPDDVASVSASTDEDEPDVDDFSYAWRAKFDPIFARKPDTLPLQAYTAVERATADCMQAAGAAYLATAHSIHTPMPKSSSSRHSSKQILPLPEPVAETVSVQKIADALDPVEDADILQTLSTVLSMESLRTHVLRPDYRGDLTRRLRVPTERIRELRLKRYIVRIRGKIPDHSFACTLFWVPKSDGKTDRTIFKGNPLNDRCNRPHPTRFTALPVMLERLTDPEVDWYLSYDFSTWFIELKLPDEVAMLFVVRLRDGSVWRVVGVPMGWTWAPTLAQSITIGLIRLTLRRLSQPAREAIHTAYGYLDNVVFALRDRKYAKEVDEVWRQVLKDFGVVLKESDCESSSIIDWLGAVITAGMRQATFRPRFQEKVADLEGMLRAGRIESTRSWWRVIALAVHIRWVRQQSLTDLIEPLRWLSRTAKELYKGTVRWSSTIQPWSSVQPAMLRAFEDVKKQFIIRAVCPRVVAYGQSDAASTGFMAFIVRLPGGMVTCVRAGKCDDSTHINVSEFRAAAVGILWTLRRPTLPEGMIDWKVDNTTAESWLQRRWSSEWHLNRLIAELHEQQVTTKTRIMISRVDGKDCVPDLLTRCAAGKEICRAPDVYSYSFKVLCTCVGICEHVKEVVQTYVHHQCMDGPCANA